MKIYLDNNLGVTNVEQEELTQDTIGYNILKVYIPNAVLTPYDTFTCYYGALLQNGRKVGWFAMEARTSTDADYEANYTLYKATLEQCVVSVEGKVYIGCQVLLGNSGNATLIKKNTAVVQFNVRKSVAINNDILVLDTDQTTTDVLESYKNLLENALTTYATKATTYTKTEVDSALALKADKSDTYTKTEVDNTFVKKSANVLVYGGYLNGNQDTIDLNDYYTNASYWVTNCNNMPTGASLGSLFVIAHSSNFLTQTFIDENGKVYTRCKNGGVWSNWYAPTYFKGFLNGQATTIDLNNYNTNGTYWVANCNNMPKNTSVGSLTIVAYASTYLTQMFIDGSTNSLYIRCNISGVWSSWKQMDAIQTQRKNPIDLNALFGKDGFYWCQNSTNNPFGSNNVGTLIVLSYSENFSSQLYIDLNGKLYTRMINGGVVGEWYSASFDKLKDYDAYKIFKKVGCVGDSYTAGWLWNSSTSSYQDHLGYSWVDYISKDSGNNYVNFGVSGATCASWLSDANGYIKAQNDICQCYLIGLGINDAGQYPVGTSSDIGTTANSYYRWYYELVTNIHNLNSNAPIFCMTQGDRNNDYNEAIRYIVTNYGNTLNLYLIDLYVYKPIFDSNYIYKEKYMGHYTPIGYQALAKVLEVAFNKVVNDNYAKFKEIAFITYDSATVYDYVDNAINDLRWELGSHTLDVESDTTTSFSKSVPSGAIGCQINTLGGMSYKVNGTIQHSAVTQIRSKNGSTIVDSLSIPSYIRNIDGYGWGVNNTCYNYIDFDSKKFIQKVGRVDLGTLNYSRTQWGQNYVFQTILSMSNSNNLLCSIYDTATPNYIYANAVDKSITNNSNAENNLKIVNSAYTDATTFKSAMNGVYLYYELATPIETDISNYIINDTIEVEPLGTLEFTNTYSQAVPSDIDYLIEEVKA